MEDYDEINNDLDNLVDRYSDEDVNENTEERELNKKEDASVKRIVPVKLSVRKPQPKLNAER